jgi:hypothetical protein
LVGNRGNIPKRRICKRIANVFLPQGGGFDQSRFVPFVAMHEFEGLLFSDCHAFADAIGMLQFEQKLKAVRDAFQTPEEINDSPQTAPSKRIAAIVPGYQKPLYGVLAAIAIGLETIRASCPHFARWLTQLESYEPGKCALDRV